MRVTAVINVMLLQLSQQRVLPSDIDAILDVVAKMIYHALFVDGTEEEM